MKAKRFLYALLASMMLALTAGLTLTACTSNKDNTVANDDWQQTLPEAIRSVPGIGKFQTAIDYSDAKFWISRPTTTDKDVDLIYYYPTTYFTSDPAVEIIADIDDAGMVAGAQKNVANNTPAYADQCNVFAPYYRQVDVNYANTLPLDDFNALTDYVSSQDPTAALDYYFNNLNQGRPFIIAGHSQGSNTTLKLLSTYFARHKELLSRMVAAYPIGYSVTDSYLAANPHLRFAEGETDTGVIVSWNTEGVGNREAKNLVVEQGAISINPLNWRRDDTYASVGENLGSYINGQMVEGIADAQIDLQRGTVIVTTEQAKSYAISGDLQSVFGPECYHGMDYNFFYANLKQNVADRIAAWLSK